MKTTDDDLDVLIIRYLDGALSGGDATRLNALIESDPEAAYRMAELAFDHAELRRDLSPEAGRKAIPVRGASSKKDSNTIRERLGGSWRWLAGAAALLCVTFGGYALFEHRRSTGDLAQDAQVISGRATVGESVVGALAFNTPVRTSERTVIALADTSRMTLEEDALFALRKPKGGERQVIELMEGKAAFAVAKASGAFLVRTAVGNTRVLGTEFSVELKPASKGEDQVKGGEAMKLSTVMLVVVMSGLVEVNVGGVSYSLTGGQSRAFGEDGGKPRPKREGGEGDKGDKGGRKHNVSGVIGSVDGGSVTLNMKGDGAAHSETIKITAATVISIQTDEDEMRAGEGGKEKRVPKTVVGTAGDLKVGMKATASVNSAGEAITITQMRAPKKEGEGEKKKEPKRQGGEGDRKPESKGKPGEDK